MKWLGNCVSPKSFRTCRWHASAFIDGCDSHDPDEVRGCHWMLFSPKTRLQRFVTPASAGNTLVGPFSTGKQHMSNSPAVGKFTSERDDDYESHCPVKAERNLLAAVLSRAICDAFGTAHCERHVIRSARQWLFGKLMPKQPFSFSWVATHLDLDPLALQDFLRNYEGDPDGLQDRLALLR